MDTKHTPGPWRLHKRGPAERYEVQHEIPGNWSPICVTFCGSQQEANARLIAAAPELLEALEAFAASVITCESCDGSGKDETGHDACHACGGYGVRTTGDTLEAYHEARAAIAKATGTP